MAVGLVNTADSIEIPCSVNAYAGDEECFKLLYESHFNRT